MIKLKRVYDKVDITDGERILIDRMWPRGIRKSTSNIDLWLKNIGPSHELRKWFGHQPSRFKMFSIRYKKELRDNRTVDKLLAIIDEEDPVTLLYSARDTKYNNAVVLLSFLKSKLKERERAGLKVKA
ncbi:MAG: DUF488 family protein [Candidatus Marsarchaeota archaeon]|jgi:uncharacterized protein YeaO (DUF488 family)|nr:DUF488 family protein [Candidatus Marsarchaeota archaeon]